MGIADSGRLADLKALAQAVSNNSGCARPPCQGPAVLSRDPWLPQWSMAPCALINGRENVRIWVQSPSNRVPGTCNGNRAHPPTMLGWPGWLESGVPVQSSLGRAPRAQESFHPSNEKGLWTILQPVSPIIGPGSEIRTADDRLVPAFLLFCFSLLSLRADAKGKCASRTANVLTMIDEDEDTAPRRLCLVPCRPGPSREAACRDRVSDCGGAYITWAGMKAALPIQMLHAVPKLKKWIDHSMHGIQPSFHCAVSTRAVDYYHYVMTEPLRTINACCPRKQTR